MRNGMGNCNDSLCVLFSYDLQFLGLTYVCESV
jgi:hypothetical protein